METPETRRSRRFCGHKEHEAGDVSGFEPWATEEREARRSLHHEDREDFAITKNTKVSSLPVSGPGKRVDEKHG
jgi:hypothetical protein